MTTRIWDLVLCGVLLQILVLQILVLQILVPPTFMEDVNLPKFDRQ